MSKKMRFEVHNPEVEARLKVLGKTLERSIPVGYGFALHVIKYGDNGEMFFTSSMVRKDYIKLLKEFITHYEEK